MTPSEYIANVLKTESVDWNAISNRLSVVEIMRYLHAQHGLVTEVGELTDALKKHIFYGQDLDRTNIIEEMGDVCWFLALLADNLKISFEDVWERNIAKLKARYGDKFSQEKAEHRDLDKEREVLEGG